MSKLRSQLIRLASSMSRGTDRTSLIHMVARAPKRPPEYKSRPGEDGNAHLRRLLQIPRRKREQDFKTYWNAWTAHAKYDDDGHYYDKDVEEAQEWFAVEREDWRYLKGLGEELPPEMADELAQKQERQEKIQKQYDLTTKWETQQPTLPSEYRSPAKPQAQAEHTARLLQIPRRKREQDFKTYWKKWLRQADPEMDASETWPGGSPSQVGKAKMSALENFALLHPDRMYQKWVSGKLSKLPRWYDSGTKLPSVG